MNEFYAAVKFLQEERMKLLQEEVRLKAKLEGIELALKILGEARGGTKQSATS